MGFLDKAKDLLSQNADKVDTVIDKAGDIVDQKTQGKYASTVDKVQEAARKAVSDNTNPQVPPTQQSGQVPPASPPPSDPAPQDPPTAPPTS